MRYHRLMRCLPLLLCLLLPTLVQADRAREAGRTATAVSDGPWVAVRHGAWFHAPDGQKARITGWAHPEERPPTRLRWISENNGRVTVEVPRPTKVSDGFHCLGSGPMSDAFTVRLQVDVADLVPVTSRELSWTFDDGTRIALPVGVPVDEDGHPRVHDALLPVIVDERFQRRKWKALPIARPYENSVAEVPLDTRLTVDGKALVIERDQKAIYPKAIEPRDGATFVALRSSCGEVVAKADGEVASEPLPKVGVLGGIEGLGGKGSALWVLESGAPLRWPDGRPAGTMSGLRYVRERDLIEHGDLRCVDEQLGSLYHEDGPPKDGVFRLCSSAWLKQ